ARIDDEIGFGAGVYYRRQHEDPSHTLKASRRARPGGRFGRRCAVAGAPSRGAGPADGAVTEMHLGQQLAKGGALPGGADGVDRRGRLIATSRIARLPARDQLIGGGGLSV